MPGLITHYICGQGVLQALPNEIAVVIEKHRRLYNIGCQGPDIFFYYLSGALKKGLRGIGTKMHNENVGAFLRAVADGLAQLSDDERTGVFAYFCGYLTHYCLDCATHPYVYYKTGFLREDDSDLRRINRLKFLAYHMRFETAIDVLLLNMVAGKKPRDEKLWRLIKVNRKEVRQVADFIGGCINAAYGVNIFGKNVLAAMTHMAFLTRFFQSKRGLRKGVLAVGEHVVLRSAVASNLIHSQSIKENIDYLNEDKNTWKVPWDDKTERNESFAELLETAETEAAKLIQLLWDCLENDGDLEKFLDIAGDRSFKTGRPIEERPVFTVYDVVFKR